MIIAFRGYQGETEQKSSFADTKRDFFFQKRANDKHKGHDDEAKEKASRAFG